MQLGTTRNAPRRRIGLLVAGLMTLSTPLGAAGAPPELHYTVAAELLHVPDGMNFGEVAGVAVNSRGQVFVFSRGGGFGGPAFGATAARLLEFVPTAASSGRSAAVSTPGALPTLSASIRRTISGPPTTARTRWCSSRLTAG